MAVEPTTGLMIVARILEALLRQEGCTASSLAEDLGSARATTYEVLRQLEQAGFIERSAQGRITPGQASAALGFAALGLGGLARAAEALLPVLRDDTDACIDLVAQDGDCETLLMRRVAPSAQADPSRPGLELTILRERIGASEAWLKLHLRPGSEPSERRAAQACLEQVADALSQALNDEPP